MRIERESLFGDKMLINDKNYLAEDIKIMLSNTEMLCDNIEKLPEKLANMYGFIIKEYDPTENYEYFIDLDIGKVFSNC